MIFQHTWEAVLAGLKTQTRRLMLVGDNQEGVTAWAVRRRSQGYPRGRFVWEVGKTYAVQPGRGQKAVGRIKLLAIRQQRLQDISEEDFHAEGFQDEEFIAVSGLGEVVQETISARFQFVETWDAIHHKRGTRWADSPLVWVLEFELVRGETGT